MHKVTVIGSGNAFNTDGRAHACYLLENSAGERMLLDFGATSLLRLEEARLDPDGIDTLLLTHFHGDHFMGLPFLLIRLSLVSRRTRDFTVAGPPGVEEKCASLLQLAYPDFEYGFRIVYREIAHEGAEFGSFRVDPRPVTHRPESLGYRITGPSGKTFAFSGDACFDERLFSLVEGVDLAIVELSLERQTDPPTPHVALDEIRRGRDCLRAGRVVFSHTSDGIAGELSPGEAARDGMVVEF